MRSKTLFLLAGLASSIIANPLLNSRQDTCSQQRLTCGAVPGANQSLCASQKSACDACEAAYEKYIISLNSNKSLAASLRNECFAASTVGDGTGVNPIISSLTVARTTPTSTIIVATTSVSSASAGTTTAASVCDQQRLDCGSALGANQSLCAVRKNSCDACEKAYESYVTSPGSNKSFAASLRNECFAASKQGTGEGVTPIISSFSAAQAGGTSVTPTTAGPSYPTASASNTAAAQPTTTSDFVTYGNGSALHSTTMKPSTILSTGTASGAGAGVPSSTSTVVIGAAESLKPFGAMGLLLLGAAMIL
ncbi:uncharacterized protein RAG0_00183 [Rhynchosporium agropyri]|uniref:Uncharacterized protein n=1 Tax=Rhynchosporium agropyri TaxID=914238 RepID=A0A1E1JS11_9HELO|nr:uncharacterized protein RAG0_00183 [Rhynchosporium agropyri]